jgi:hypothetical protein
MLTDFLTLVSCLKTFQKKWDLDFQVRHSFKSHPGTLMWTAQHLNPFVVPPGTFLNPICLHSFCLLHLFVWHVEPPASPAVAATLCLPHCYLFPGVLLLHLIHPVLPLWHECFIFLLCWLCQHWWTQSWAMYMTPSC